MLLSYNSVRELFSVLGDVKISQNVPVEALVSTHIWTVENCVLGARGPAYTHFVGNLTRNSTDRIVIRELQVGKICILLIASFVNGNGRYISHCVDNTFN